MAFEAAGSHRLFFFYYLLEIVFLVTPRKIMADVLNRVFFNLETTGSERFAPLLLRTYIFVAHKHFLLQDVIIHGNNPLEASLFEKHCPLDETATIFFYEDDFAALFQGLVEDRQGFVQRLYVMEGVLKDDVVEFFGGDILVEHVGILVLKKSGVPERLPKLLSAGDLFRIEFEGGAVCRLAVHCKIEAGGAVAATAIPDGGFGGEVNVRVKVSQPLQEVGFPEHLLLKGAVNKLVIRIEGTVLAQLFTQVKVKFLFFHKRASCLVRRFLSVSAKQHDAVREEWQMVS